MTDMWMVRAGPGSFLINDFLQNNMVAIGWNLGDLTDKSDEEIAELYKKKYKNQKSVYQILRFKNEINVGDYVLSANGRTKTYFIGKIISDYYRSEVINKKDSSGDNYFDVRDVEWLGEVQRYSLKKPTQKNIGENTTVFKIKDYAQEDIIKVCRSNNDVIDNVACIIRRYADENDLGDLTDEKTEQLLSKFQSMFSPDKLKSLEGRDILYTIFPQKGNYSTLCYNLEFSDDFKWLCGGIRGGSSFKFSLFKYGETDKWTVGAAKSSLKSITEDEAISLATEIRDAIVKGAEYIQNNNLESVYDYILLENELNTLFKDSHKKCPIIPTHSWIHKYYTLIFPDKFLGIHVDNMKKDSMRKFRIEPENGFYATDAQFYQLAKRSGIKLNSLYDERIVKLFFESEDIWDPINEGKLVELDECVRPPFVCNKKRNMIYFGAPGTGKSYNLNQDKDNLLKNYPKNYERVTFHPDYSYANFVGTYKPVPEGKDITYRYVPGPFMRILKKAIEKPSEPFLLVIEEINRANVAAVFGDVFQLLDRNEENVSEYDIATSEDMKTYLNKERIFLPSNLFIWATMNSADQGVFPMDTAFKRRWDFKYFSINHNEKLIENTRTIINDEEVNWNKLRKQINDELLSYKINEDKLMGPFFAFNEFMGQEIPTETFKDIFKNKIIMYLFEDSARAKRNDLFSGARTKDYVTYSEICDEFDRNGLKIFKFISDDE